MAVDWGTVALEHVLAALKKVVKPDIEGRYVYNVKLTIGDDSEKEIWIAVEAGNVEIGDGVSEEEGAVPFEIKRDPIGTMKAMMSEGLTAASALMMGGAIYTTNIAGAQKWFEIFNISPEAFEAAVEEVIAAGGTC